MTNCRQDETSAEILEMQRTRWQRARGRLGMASVIDKPFATRGLASRVRDLSVRFLILPSDPDCSRIRFPSEFWDWWQNPPKNPFGESITSFGSEHSPAVDAAVTYKPDNRADGLPYAWKEYIALTRAGELEFGLSSTAANSTANRRFFHLLNIVGRIWVTLHRYTLAVEKFNLIGPFEASFAMEGTSGSGLANLATGWGDYARDPWENGILCCREKRLLFRQELNEWPEVDGCRDLAFEFGERIVNAWGVKEAMFLALSGVNEGDFDVSQYY